jgi:hypothetical protein
MPTTSTPADSSVAGHVFVDLDRDSVFDTGEPNLPGVTVTLTSDRAPTVALRPVPSEFGRYSTLSSQTACSRHRSGRRCCWARDQVNPQRHRLRTRGRCVRAAGAAACDRRILNVLCSPFLRSPPIARNAQRGFLFRSSPEPLLQRLRTCPLMAPSQCGSRAAHDVTRSGRSGAPWIHAVHTLGRRLLRTFHRRHLIAVLSRGSLSDAVVAGLLPVAALAHRAPVP